MVHSLTACGGFNRANRVPGREQGEQEAKRAAGREEGPRARGNCRLRKLATGQSRVFLKGHFEKK